MNSPSNTQLPIEAGLAPNFNALAPIYRWMELATFGPFLHRARCAFLGELAQARQAIVLGDGDGRFTAALLRANPAVEIDAVDASSAMLRALTRRACPPRRPGSNCARVRTHLADVRAWQPSSSTQAADLIVTHFFLDCLTTEEVEALAGKLHAGASPTAIWILSDFAIPQGAFGRVIAAPIVSSLYIAFAWLTGLRVRRLPDHASALRRAGFTLRSRQTFLAGLLFSELWSAS